MLRSASPRRPKTSRQAFTLFEMILAMSIGLIILGALYWTMTLHLTSTQAGRELVQDGTLARAVLTRITSDVVCSLGPVDPKVLPEAGTASSTSDPGAPPSSSTASSSTASSSTASSSTASSSSSKSTTTTDTATVDSIVFNLGVQGQTNQLTLYVSRVPRELNLNGFQGQTATRFAADLRRITYWVSDAGLCRQEITMVTSQDIDTLPPNVDNPKVIAPEVKKIEFEFFDGSGWWPTWDGDAKDPSADLAAGDIRIGPPSAIAVTITIERPLGEGQGVSQRTYRQVIALPAGNNYPQNEPQ